MGRASKPRHSPKLRLRLGPPLLPLAENSLAFLVLAFTSACTNHRSYQMIALITIQGQGSGWLSLWCGSASGWLPQSVVWLSLWVGPYCLLTASPWLAVPGAAAVADSMGTPCGTRLLRGTGDHGGGGVNRWV